MFSWNKCWIELLTSPESGSRSGSQVHTLTSFKAEAAAPIDVFGKGVRLGSLLSNIQSHNADSSSFESQNHTRENDANTNRNRNTNTNRAIAGGKSSSAI